MNAHPWLYSNDKGVPYLPQRYPHRSMVEVVGASAGERPYRTLLFHRVTRITYEEFVRQSEAVAACLMAKGVRKGECVAILLPNSPHLVVCLHGIWRAGAVAVPVSLSYQGEDMGRVVMQAQVSAVITASSFYNCINDVRPWTAIRGIVAVDTEQPPAAGLNLPSALGLHSKGTRGINLADGDTWFHDVLRKFKNAKWQRVEITPFEPAVVLSSDGTEGSAGVHTLTHEWLVTQALQNVRSMGTSLEPWEDRFLLAVPPSHTRAWLAGLNLAMINHSSCILYDDTQEVSEVLKGIRKYAPAFMYGTPSVYDAITEHPAVRSGKVSLKNFKLCIAGGAPLNTELEDRFQNVTGVRLAEGYDVPVPGQSDAIDSLRLVRI